MFTGIGVTEILLILAALVLLFGARRLPEIARGLGTGIRNFKGSLREPPEGSDELGEAPTEDRPDGQGNSTAEEGNAERGPGAG